VSPWLDSESPQRQCVFCVTCVDVSDEPQRVRRLQYVCRAPLVLSPFVNEIERVKFGGPATRRRVAACPTSNGYCEGTSIKRRGYFVKLHPVEKLHPSSKSQARILKWAAQCCPDDPTALTFKSLPLVQIRTNRAFVGDKCGRGWHGWIVDASRILSFCDG